MCLFISSLITKLDAMKKPQFCGQNFLFTFLKFYSSQSLFWCHYHFQSPKSRELFMIINRGAVQISHWHRTAVLLLLHIPLPPSPLKSRWDIFSVPLHELRPNPRPTLARKYFLRSLSVRNVSGKMSHFVGGKYIYRWVCGGIRMPVCICVLICAHFTSIKTQPRLLGPCVPEYSSNKWASQISVTASWLWVWAPLSNRKVNRKDKDETKNINLPQWKIMLMSQYPLEILQCSNLLYYYFMFL